MVPGFAHRVVVFPGVGIDHQRQRGQTVQMLQRGGSVLQRNTVNAQRHHLRRVRKRRHHFAQRRAVAEMPGVAQGK